MTWLGRSGLVLAWCTGRTFNHLNIIFLSWSTKNLIGICLTLIRDICVRPSFTLFIRRSNLPTYLKGAGRRFWFRHASVYWARMSCSILLKALYWPNSALRIKFKFLSWHPKYLIWHLLLLQPRLHTLSPWHPAPQRNWIFLFKLECDAFTSFSLQVFPFGWGTWEVAGKPKIASR